MKCIRLWYTNISNLPLEGVKPANPKRTHAPCDNSGHNDADDNSHSLALNGREDLSCNNGVDETVTQRDCEVEKHTQLRGPPAHGVSSCDLISTCHQSDRALARPYMIEEKRVDNDDRGEESTRVLFPEIGPNVEV